MPGIHIRTLSQCDWLNQEKGSLLIIPGSYWLCHKKSIYKFIFKYHRTMRNTTQFLYGRELSKVIRRIIKCHPTQGQQFGTEHLVITYNIDEIPLLDAIVKNIDWTSWTRQDKMFATLKFQERTNAVAFSYAFVLTIRMCPLSEHLLLDLKYPTIKDIKTEYGVIQDILNQDPKTNFNLEGNINSSANFHENVDTIENSTITAENFVNNHTEFQTDKCMNYNIKGHKRKMKKDLDHTKEQSLSSRKKINEIEKTHSIDKETGSIQKQNQKMQIVRECEMETPFIKIVKNFDEWPLLNKSNFDKLIEKDNIDNKNHLNDKERDSETIINPNNIRCQYFTKKDMKDTRHTTEFISDTFLAIDQSMRENLQDKVKNISQNSSLKIIEINDAFTHTKQEEYYNKITDLKSQENDEQHVRTSSSTDDDQSYNTYNKIYKTCKPKSREFERKVVSHNKILCSSNITDLVMEGLMFTIRQDQDNVAVIEQKTKLEMDEVLENSVKVETKAGEKCLLNSNLLRLENLVTMIELPSKKNKQPETDYEINNKAYLPFRIFSDNATNNLNVNCIDEKMDKSKVINYDKCNAAVFNPCEFQWQHEYISSNIKNNHSYLSEQTMEESEQLTVWQSIKRYEQNRKNENTKVNKQEKNVIPSKVLQSTTVAKTIIELQDINLPIDDINMKKTDKCDTSVKKYSSLLPSSLSNLNKVSKEISIISNEPGLTKLSREEVNVPQIVSDIAITIDQMPITLQKILQHTCSMRKYFSTINNKTLQRENKIQHTESVEDAIPTIDVLLDDKCTNSNNLLPIQSLINYEETKNNKNKSHIIIDKNVSNINEDICARNIKRKNNEIHHILQGNSLLKHHSSRKLQDITEDFYYDLLHVHNKDSAIWQKCFGQRQKSLNNPDNIKNRKIHIEMLKFIQDITEGARVVIKRLNINKKNLINQKGILP